MNEDLVVRLDGVVRIDLMLGLFHEVFHLDALFIGAVSYTHLHLLAELDVILDRYGTAEVESIDIGQFLGDILNVTRQTKVTLPSSVTMVSRGLVTMEGTLLEYVGSFNMVDIINKHIKRTKETSDDFKDTVKELLVAVNGARCV